MTSTDIGPPIDVSKHLKGIDFPAQKEDLVQHASEQGADQDVIELLEQLPEKEYGNMADVMKGVGQA